MSKALIVLAIGLLAVGCDTTPTMKSVAGTYKIINVEDVGTIVLLDNGVWEGYENGKLHPSYHDRWEITKEGELHATESVGIIAAFRINKDASLTAIATIRDGKREDFEKDCPPMIYKKEVGTSWWKIK